MSKDDNQSTKCSSELFHKLKKLELEGHLSQFLFNSFLEFLQGGGNFEEKD